MKPVSKNRPTDVLVILTRCCLKSVLNQYAPVTSKQLAERRSAPWLNDSIRQAKRERRGAEKRWLKSGLNIGRDIYNAKRQNVKTCIRKAKEDHFSDRLKDSKSCKQLFGICDELLGRTKQRCVPNKINPNELPKEFAAFLLLQRRRAWSPPGVSAYLPPGQSVISFPCHYFANTFLAGITHHLPASSKLKAPKPYDNFRGDVDSRLCAN
ncbi:ATP-dependent DNA helicase [Elysia marginata]|uniref:ATP-dependent DNA helicase n=1 Tax=Elysia marginata TaxID=1093978 RepID=A0AAV4J776_9GAST|nr:ATP-dependent DNA helicase [Elysia marginata]